MSSRAGSTFVTFLVSIPVAAAGLMAVFGVPPLSSVIAASRELKDSISGDDESHGGRKSTQSQFEEWDSAPGWSEETDLSKPGSHAARDASLTDVGADKSDREVDDLGFSKPREGTRSKSRETRIGRPGTKREEFASVDNSEFGSSKSGTNRQRDLVSETGTRAVPMKESLKKLNSLGVKHYHLERGASQDTWLFVCLFSPGADTRVTHRFEAESNDPEGAVAETLKQIDTWLLNRFRDQQPISQNAL